MTETLHPDIGGCCSTGAIPGLTQDRMEVTVQPRNGRSPLKPAQIDVMIPGIHCAGCMGRIERGLAALDGIASARVNLSLRRASIGYHPDKLDVEAILGHLSAIGYEARPFDVAAMAEIDRDQVGRDLLARMAVAGFAAMNVMLLSVSVWSGAEAATRDLLHWISALIALPAMAFSGVPFFRSALSALKAGRLNMDVPISLAVCLAALNSLFETAQGGDHAYFDAGISLIFFLLIGRYLDHRTRAIARSAAVELTALSARSATVIDNEGERKPVTIEALAPGALVEVVAGERIPADGLVETGRSEIDRSMVTGETMPAAVAPGSEVHAGMLNLTAPVRVRVKATGEATLLADIARMIESAEQGRTRYDRWADRAARVYAPGVHLIAGVALIGWYLATGDLRLALAIATAVLIITCPCALALAVPAVHAVAGGRLFRRGIFLKDGTALERLAGIDMVVFDKTGTLTAGDPVLTDAPADDHPAWPVAMGMATASTHPLSVALVRSARAKGMRPAEVSDLREEPGQGISARIDGEPVQLGRAGWLGAEVSDATTVWLKRGDHEAVAFRFEDMMKPDAARTCAALRARGLPVALFSGDAAGPVARVAKTAGIADARAGMTPADKLAALEELARQGRRVLMVGDGINDAPALAAAYASMSPVSASEVSQAAASFVFTGEYLEPVLYALDTARMARSRALENFGLAALYNAIAVPVALAGLVTPLIAALAMSGSSIAVTLNALRIRGAK